MIISTAGLAQGAIEVLLVLVLITGALIVSRKNLPSLLSAYRLQSAFIALMALSLYAESGSAVLAYLALLTLASKVVVIPWTIQAVKQRIKVRRDLEFHYLTAPQSMAATLMIILLVYASLSRALALFSLSSLFYLGAVTGVTLALMGMLITFSRRKIITKIIGYLTMENGVLLFSLFITELPFIIEVLVLIDLLMIVVLLAILGVGMDASIEEFQDRLHPLRKVRWEIKEQGMKRLNGKSLKGLPGGER